MKTIEKYHLHMQAARLAPSTISVYLTEFKQYCVYFKERDIRYIKRDSILEYMKRLYDSGYSGSKVNQAINAIKFYKEKVLGEKKNTYFIKRPRQDKFIPTILPFETIQRIINAPSNLKHRTILFCIYHSALRISEAINLSLMDFRSKQKNPQLIIRKSKHRHSRIIPITEECVDLVRQYYLQYRPKTYLFEGAIKNKKISETTIRNILDKACRKCEIKENLRVHDLRHNFVTHCLQRGTSLHHISKFIGHKSTQTTEKYYAHLMPEDLVIIRPQADNPLQYLKVV